MHSKTKIGKKVAHVTRDSDTTFKVKRSQVKVTRPLYSPRRLRIRQLQRSPWERIHRRNPLLRCGQAPSARRREALRRPEREGRGGDILWRLPHSLLLLTAKHRLGRSVFTPKQVFGPRTAKIQPIWIKFCIHLLLYGIHLWADLDSDRRVDGSRPNQNDYVFVCKQLAQGCSR